MNDWGTPEKTYPPEKGAPEVRLGGGRGLAPESAVLRRRATTALIVNVVLIFLAGFLCIPGAVLAAMSLSEVRQDPARAQRLLRWSWGFLAANLLFYVLLVITVVIIAVYVILAASRA